MKSKKKNVKDKRINLSPLAIVILTIVIIGLAVFFIIHDADKVNTSFSLTKKLYNLLFSN